MFFRIKKTIMIMLIDLIILLAIATIAGSVSGINTLVDKEYGTALKASAGSLAAVYESHNGMYEQRADGKIYKGDFCISDHVEVVDTVKNASGCEATFFWGDTRAVTSIKDESNRRITGTKTTDKNVIDTVLGKGETYFSNNMVINGSKYYVMYYPVFQTGSKQVVGMTFVGVPSGTVSTSIANVVMQTMLFFVVIGAITMVVTAKILNSLIKAIHDTVDASDSMANGDMTFTVVEGNTKRKDEMGEMYRALLRLRDSLKETFGNFKETSDNLVETSATLDKMADETARTIGHVESAVEDIANGATAQAQDASKAQEDVMDMGKLIEDTVDEIKGLREESNKMTDSGETALSILQDLIKVNTDAIKAIELIAEQTNETNESALKIREATDIITSIASETNLLSLNASIEAARAGDAGRGFAVVADQISKLAEQSNQSGRDIEEITNSLIADSNKAVETMKEVRAIMDDQTEKMTTTGKAFNEVKIGIGNSKNSVENINQMATKLDKARKEMIDIIQNLTAVAEENAASTEETSAATNEVSAATQNVANAAISLKGITNDLNEDLSKFKY